MRQRGVTRRWTGGAARWRDSDAADNAAVVVLLAPFDRDAPAEQQVGEALARFLAEGLLQVRGVDAGEPNRMPGPGNILDNDDVAADYLDHLALQGFAPCSRGGEQGTQGQPRQAAAKRGQNIDHGGIAPGAARNGERSCYQSRVAVAVNAD